MSMRKIASLLLVAVMMFTIVAACSSPKTSNQGDSQGQTPSSGTSGTSGDKATPPVTLTMMVQNHQAFPLNEDWLVWKLHEENTGLNLKVSGYQGDWWDAIPLVFASGDWPDLMWMSGIDGIYKYGADGALINYLDHLDKMPNLKKWLDDHPEAAQSTLSVDGAMYVHPSEGAFSKAFDRVRLYRKDIFDNHNLKLPTTPEEYYDVLYQLKQIYPDSYPLLMRGLNSDAVGSIVKDFGSNFGFYYNDNENEFVFGAIEDNFKKAIEFTAKLYADKLIPIDFLSLDSSQVSELITNNKTFVMNTYVNNLDLYENQMKESNPNFTLALMPPLIDPYGHQYSAREGFLTEGLMVTSKTKNLDAALKYVDYLFTDAAREAVSWGKEGVTFEIKDGKKQFLPSITDQTSLVKEFGMRSSTNIAWADPEANFALMSENSRTAIMESDSYVGPGGIGISGDVPLTKDEKDAIELKTEAIGKYRDEQLSKFIMGTRPLSEWDDYVNGYEKLGLEDVLNVYKQAYDRAMSQ